MSFYIDVKKIIQTTKLLKKSQKKDHYLKNHLFFLCPQNKRKRNRKKGVKTKKFLGRNFFVTFNQSAEKKL